MFKSVKIKGCSASIPPDAPVKPHLAGEAIDGRGLSVITLFMSLPASLNVIARRSPLSVIIRLDRIIHATEYHLICRLLPSPPGIDSPAGYASLAGRGDTG